MKTILNDRRSKAAWWALCATGLAFVASDAIADPVTGTYTGTVVSATDLNNASFGRDVSAWLGKPVTGTFSFDPAVPGIADVLPSAADWILQPSPGPGPFTEFVTITAVIDGRVFQTSRADYTFIFFGDVVGMQNSGPYRWFGPQDSFVGTGPAGTGRSVVGFDAYYLPTGDSFDGTTLTLDPTLFQFGSGIVDDLLESNGATIRQGTIRFQVTSVSLTSAAKTPEELLGELSADVLEFGLKGGIGNALTSKLQNALRALENGNAQAALGMLHAFINSVEAQRNKALTGTQADT